MIDISTWEIFFVGARTLIGERHPDMHRPGASECVRPVYQIERGPSERGMGTIVFPVGWFPVQELALPADVMSVPVSSLGAAEQKMLAQSVAKADEMLQRMRAASSGIAIASTMPAGPK